MVLQWFSMDSLLKNLISSSSPLLTLWIFVSLTCHLTVFSLPLAEARLQQAPQFNSAFRHLQDDSAPVLARVDSQDNVYQRLLASLKESQPDPSGPEAYDTDYYGGQDQGGVPPLPYVYNSYLGAVNPLDDAAISSAYGGGLSLASEDQNQDLEPVDPIFMKRTKTQAGEPQQGGRIAKKQGKPLAPINSEFVMNLSPGPDMPAAEPAQVQEEPAASPARGSSTTKLPKSETYVERRYMASDEPLPVAAPLRDHISGDYNPFQKNHRTSSGIQSQHANLGDVYFVALVAGVSAAAVFGVVAAGYIYYKFNQNSKAAADVDYPSYGVVGPTGKDKNSPPARDVPRDLPLSKSGDGSMKDEESAAGGKGSPAGGSHHGGDKKLAASAAMFVYHHKKQQVASEEKSKLDSKSAADQHSDSKSNMADDEESEDDLEYEGVYECPGLAPTGEMEVKNPLFNENCRGGSEEGEDGKEAEGKENSPPAAAADQSKTSGSQQGKKKSGK